MIKIEKNTPMILFRYSNFGKQAFIPSLLDTIEREGYTWLLKSGKRTSMDKIQKVLQKGGYLVLRAPKADGSKSYIAQFSSVREEKPDDKNYPKYYDEYLEKDWSDFFTTPSFQWFKIENMRQLEEDAVKHLVLSLNHKRVDDVIGTTRTAVMFVENDIELIL